MKTKHYFPPTVTPDEVSLSDFAMSDILEYVKHKKAVAIEDGETPRADGSIVIPAEDAAHIETLALCGQREYAREELLRIVSEQIGRPL